MSQIETSKSTSSTSLMHQYLKVLNWNKKTEFQNNVTLISFYNNGLHACGSSQSRENKESWLVSEESAKQQILKGSARLVFIWWTDAQRR